MSCFVHDFVLLVIKSPKRTAKGSSSVCLSAHEIASTQSFNIFCLTYNRHHQDM